MSATVSFMLNHDYQGEQGYFPGYRLNMKTTDIDSKDTDVALLPYGIFVAEDGENKVKLITADTEIIAGVVINDMVTENNVYTWPTLGTTVPALGDKQPASVGTRGVIICHTPDTIAMGATIYAAAAESATIGNGYVTTTSVGNIALAGIAKVYAPTSVVGTGLVALEINIP